MDCGHKQGRANLSSLHSLDKRAGLGEVDPLDLERLCHGLDEPASLLDQVVRAVVQDTLHVLHREGGLPGGSDHATGGPTSGALALSPPLVHQVADAWHPQRLDALEGLIEPVSDRRRPEEEVQDLLLYKNDAKHSGVSLECSLLGLQCSCQRCPPLVLLPFPHHAPLYLRVMG